VVRAGALSVRCPYVKPGASMGEPIQQAKTQSEAINSFMG
jgi:hypothetical protein